MTQGRYRRIHCRAHASDAGGDPARLRVDHDLVTGQASSTNRAELRSGSTAGSWPYSSRAAHRSAWRPGILPLRGVARLHDRACVPATAFAIFLTRKSIRKEP